MHSEWTQRSPGWVGPALSAAAIPKKQYALGRGFASHLHVHTPWETEQIERKNNDEWRNVVELEKQQECHVDADNEICNQS
jgi:hypothetical protein